MKKKLLTLLLVCAMVLSTGLVVFAGDNVSGSDAVKADANNAVVIDVRSTANHVKGSLAGSVNWPLFTDDNQLTSGSDELAQAFTQNANNNKEALANKEIYILCNSGARGAQNATTLLVAAGYDEAKLHTITNGAKDLEVRYAFLNTNNTVTGAEAVTAGENAVVLDVRNDVNYNKGHLAGSLHIPVFTEAGAPAGTANDDIAKSFVEAVTDNAELKNKDIYVLCNSGARGARAATVLLADAGYAVENIYTITGGAKDEAVSAALVATVSEYKFVSGSDALKAADKNAVVIDVRSEANFQKGSITEYNWPLFNDAGVTNGRDDLAKAFLATVEANAELLAGKDIYILCNSGARGAQNATQLLAYAGYNVAATDDGVVYTVKNGAKDLEIRYALLNTNNTVTGAEAVAAGENAVVIDVRTAANYGKGHLKGALHIPVFTENGPVGTASEDLAKAFITAVTDNAALKDKNLYILCNSGARGARAATVLLVDAGYSVENIYTITGGAKDADVAAASYYVSGEFTVSVLDDSNYLVLDVRNAGLYEAGHLKGSLSLPVFDKDNQLPDDLAKAFSDYVAANKATFDGKTILVLCNSGARGAVKATELLNAAGYTNVFTIEGGAKSVVKDFFETATAETPEEEKPSTPSSPQTGDSSSVMLYAFVMAVAVVVIARKKEIFR